MKTKVVICLMVVISAQYVNGTANLTLPTPTNCGNQAVLTCTSTDCNQGYRFLKDGVTIYNQNGSLGVIDKYRYHGTVTSSSTVKLTITNIQLSDAGAYVCNCGFDRLSSSLTMQYMCMASTSTAEIMSNKTLRISVDRLYPQPQDLATNLTIAANQIQGTHTCKPSSTLASHFSCTWMTTTSLLDGNHSYTIMVDRAKVYGSFRIVTPSSPTISNLTTIPNNVQQVLRGIQDTPLTIKCVSKGGIPAPTLAWYRNNTSTFPLAQSYDSDCIPQSDGTYNVTLTYSFTPNRTDDLMSMLCRLFYPGASNEISPDPNPAKALLYLELKPDIPAVSQTGYAVSGGNMTLRCSSANGRPAPNITWTYRGQTFSPYNSQSLDKTSETYTVVSVLQRPVSAEDNGQTATCSVMHKTLSAPIDRTVIVDVKYPPEVNVSTTTSSPYTITCTAEGYPGNYTYQDWVQIWPGYGPVAMIPFTGTNLTLTNVTYENSGLYVCSASNGVAEYGTDVKYMNGTGTISISSPPVLTDPYPGGTNVPVAGRLDQDATTEIKYWSNVNDSVVRCYKHVGDSRSSSSRCYVTYTDTEVTLPVYNHIVKETGTLAIIKIHISTKEDMTDYDVVVSNSVQGESVLVITIVPHGPPEAPTLTGNFNITPGQVVLTVVPGFNGGYNQTLVVQISTDLTTWINNTSVYIGMESRTTDVILVSLRENTLHYVRVFAYNTAGGSNNFSTVMNFITTKGNDSRHGSSSGVALIAGGVSGVFVLVAVGVVVVIACKRRKASKRNQKGKDTSHLGEDSNSSAIVECVMYESAGNVQPGSSTADLYSKPKKKANIPVADVYAVVSKPKKDLYENAPKPAAKNVDFSPIKVAQKTKKNSNTDGLIYAELEFNKNHDQSVIHGLDDATTYIQVDFTKAADPLPECCDEEPNVDI